MTGAVADLSGLYRLIYIRVLLFQRDPTPSQMTKPEPFALPRSKLAFHVSMVVLLIASCAPSTDEPVVVGTLERDRIELIAEVQEPIVEILCREGDLVTTGAPLLRLDTSRLDAQVARARSARDQADARLRELLRGPRSERIAEARARLAATETNIISARQNLDRANSLLDDGVGTRERADNEQARFDEAIARRDEARATLDSLLEGTTPEELDQARAILAEAEASLAELEIRAERLEVRAPRPGQIDALPFEIGEQPPAGAVVVVMLAEQAPYARVYVPEPLRAGVRPGSLATIQVDGVARVFSGRVRVISHEATFTPYFALTEYDRSRLSFLAEVDLIEPEAGELPTGIPVQLRFQPDESHEASEQNE